jgi:hypothetical protein
MIGRGASGRVALKDNKAAALKAFNDENNKDFRDRAFTSFASACPTGISPPTKPR